MDDPFPNPREVDSEGPIEMDLTPLILKILKAAHPGWFIELSCFAIH